MFKKTVGLRIFLIVLLAVASIETRINAGQAATLTNSQKNVGGTGTATGTAIGNGFKAFFTAAFPEGATLLSTIQGWLSQKLNSKQQSDVTAGANQKQAKPTADPNIKTAASEIQSAAQVLEYGSVVLDHSNQATAKAFQMMGQLSQTKDGQMPDGFRKNWNAAKAELDAISEDKDLEKVREATHDLAVIGALQQLERASKGPVKTIEDIVNSKANNPPPFDSKTVQGELLEIISATSSFNNLGTALLGSTGMELNNQVNSLVKAGGSSSLDNLAQDSVSRALASIPRPQ